MDLHGIVKGVIGAVNPLVPATMQISTGYTDNADGSRTPTYSTLAVNAQVQSMTYMDLRQVEGLNLNGTRRAIYLEGEFNGVNRPSQKGGDLVTLTDGPNAGIWLIAQVIEQWENWCKVIVTLQDGS
jgi:hypothetical protein